VATGLGIRDVIRGVVGEAKVEDLFGGLRSGGGGLGLDLDNNKVGVSKVMEKWGIALYGYVVRSFRVIKTGLGVILEFNNHCNLGPT
jgi:hypothetical protein